jgi:hypothetical protein
VATELKPAYEIKRRSRAQTGLSDELEQQKQQMEKALRDRAQRLSRLSVRLTESGKGNLTTKLKQFEVDQLNAQMEELVKSMQAAERERR